MNVLREDEDGLDILRFFERDILDPTHEKHLPHLCIYVHELFDEKDNYKGIEKFKEKMKQILDAYENIKYFNDIFVQVLNEKGKVEKLLNIRDPKARAALIKDITQLKQENEELQILLSSLEKAIRLYWDDYVNSKLWPEKIDMEKITQKFTKEILEILHKLDALLDRAVKQSYEFNKNKIYQDYTYAEPLEIIKSLWEQNFKNKSDWLYHGTSTIFLPFIKTRGLDNKQLPRGIKSAIERISKIISKYRKEKISVPVDVVKDMSKKPISLAIDISKSISSSAKAEALPAFLYEILNKEHVLKYYSEIIEQLTPEEREICESVWRFGKKLRARNNIVLLYIKFDSEFLQLVGFPDYLSDFDAFYPFFKKEFLLYFKEDYLPEKNTPLNLKKRFYGELFERFGDIKQIYFFEASPIWKTGISALAGAPREIQVDSIPPKFIFLKMKIPFGEKLINIEDWDSDIEVVLENKAVAVI